jgi:hypothetical protein
MCIPTRHIYCGSETVVSNNTQSASPNTILITLFFIRTNNFLFKFGVLKIFTLRKLECSLKCSYIRIVWTEQNSLNFSLNFIFPCFLVGEAYLGSLDSSMSSKFSDFLSWCSYKSGQQSNQWRAGNKGWEWWLSSGHVRQTYRQV